MLGSEGLCGLCFTDYPIDRTILISIAITVPVDAPARGGGGVGGRAPGEALPGVRPVLHPALQARFVFVLFCFVVLVSVVVLAGGSGDLGFGYGWVEMCVNRMRHSRAKAKPYPTEVDLRTHQPHQRTPSHPKHITAGTSTRRPGIATCTSRAPRWPSSSSFGTRASSSLGSSPSVRACVLYSAGGLMWWLLLRLLCLSVCTICPSNRRYPSLTFLYPYPPRQKKVFGLNLFELTFMLPHGMLEFVLMGVVFMGLGKHVTGSYRKPWGTYGRGRWADGLVVWCGVVVSRALPGHGQHRAFRSIRSPLTSLHPSLHQTKQGCSSSATSLRGSGTSSWSATGCVHTHTVHSRDTRSIESHTATTDTVTN